MDPDRHLVLVGLMGVGKSTVAAAVAKRLRRPLVDTDREVERRTGRSVREIFAEDGEAAFREMEADVVRDALASERPAVIAAAGGVVLSEASRALLRRPGARVVWLCATPGLLHQRVQRSGHRPLLDHDPVGTLQRMYDERGALYKEVADLIVSVDNRTVADIAEAVLR